MSNIPPYFYQQLKHNRLRRADWHDYRAKCFYLITLMKNLSPEVPNLSNLKNLNGNIITDFTWTGWCAYNAITKFKSDFPFIKIWRYIIMPDHVHLILYVMERTEEHLGQYVRSLKALCSHNFQVTTRLTDVSLFEDGFNDRILFSKQKTQLDNWTNYVLDNPRRLWLMRSNPDFFTKTSLARSENLPENLWTENQTPILQLYGNRLLLEYPELFAVRFSHTFSAEEWQKKKVEALRVAKNGGVLVSPFIHKEEKAILEDGLLLGAKVIKVIADGFSDRTKPQGADFHHCAEGRMLLIAMNGGAYTPTRTGREICRRMNKLALWISENPEKLK